jgi:hypothetical protein
MPPFHQISLPHHSQSYQILPLQFRLLLVDFFQSYNDDVLKLIGIGKSAATYQKYELTRMHLQKFIQLKCQITDISLKEIMSI